MAKKKKKSTFISHIFKKIKNISLKFKILIVLFVLALFCYTIFFMKYKENYDLTLSDKGLSLLNSYEFPYYMVDEENDCLSPYDVGDGVITFGPGITYPTEQEGLDAINSEFDSNYTESDNCISTKILFDMQQKIISPYEHKVIDFLWSHKYIPTQNQFDALLLMSYNSPSLFDDEKFNELFKTDLSKTDYINTINSYYQTLNSYYDNEDTPAPNDGFGEGWLNRIQDSADAFFDSDYDYQNF